MILTGGKKRLCLLCQSNELTPYLGFNARV